MLEIQKQYMETFLSISIVFKEDIDEDFIIENNMIYIKGTESFVPGILDKTIKALEITKNIDYDVLLRSNISTVIDYRKLNILFNNLTSDIEYMGGALIKLKWLDQQGEIVTNEYYNTYFISGTSIILSKNIVNQIINNKHMLPNIIDDVAIGVICHKLGFEPRGFNDYFCVNYDSVSDQGIFI